jgi:hypothetical protein
MGRKKRDGVDPRLQPEGREILVILVLTRPWVSRFFSVAPISVTRAMDKLDMWALLWQGLGEGKQAQGSSSLRTYPLRLCPHFSIPNEVILLQKENQTKNSVTLRWEAPADLHSQVYTYEVHWISKENPQGHLDNSMVRTNDTWYEVEALEPGTFYNFSVWAERSGAASSTPMRCSTLLPLPG